MTIFRFSFIRFTLIDLIDVFIVAYFFYRALIFLKDTRSIQMIFGLIVIFTVSFLAYWFELGMVKWLFSNVVIAGIIVMAVVFQPELRRALTMLGQSRLLRLFISTETKTANEAIIIAAEKLADMHYGALMVIERNVKLRTVVESGKMLNATVSSEILQSIFTPYTPLHDGAVVIRGDMIVAANCTLPLSQNPSYHRLHGMRHKAGVGVTEDSDAFVIIVSEETGQISYAFNGHLNRDIKPAELAGILSDSFNQG